MTNKIDPARDPSGKYTNMTTKRESAATAKAAASENAIHHLENVSPSEPACRICSSTVDVDKGDGRCDPCADEGYGRCDDRGDTLNGNETIHGNDISAERRCDDCAEDSGPALIATPEAIAKLKALIGPDVCRVCGSSDDVEDSDRCDDCIRCGSEQCRQCHETYNEQGDGYDGMCADCADQSEGPWCSDCGERMTVDSNGVSEHVDDDGDPLRGDDGPGHVALVDQSRDYIER